MERVLRDEVLALLKAREGKPLSGEEMSRALGVSRAAVWKAMESLRDEGYVISSAPRRGYALEGSPDRLSAGELAGALAGRRVGRALVCLETVDSTNNEVKRRALAGAADGLAVVAEQQTGGRGRRGRSFVSPAGQGLYLSVLLRPRSPVRRCCVRRIPPRKQRNTPHSPPWAPAGVRAPQSRRWRSAKPGEPAAPVPRRRIR